MLVSAYDEFVQKTDQSIGKSVSERYDIAIYGLSSEIGSVVSAIKKRLLKEDGKEILGNANDEIREELGDVIWYCFSLARIANPKKPINILAHNIAILKKELEKQDDRATRIRSALDAFKLHEFTRSAKEFPKKTKGMKFEDYQTLAFLTARTDGRTLVEVCLAVLWQLSAQLFLPKLPQIELELNKVISPSPINLILSEIAWHISALASIYKLKLSDITKQNIEKVSFRLDRENPTPLHDEENLPSQQFPRRFEVGFVTVAKGRSRMYFDGRQLGDDLTDNSYDDDGYRYHDIMHFANVAKLGWSPVLRGLMGRKRKSIPIVDEVEDGARARIVEEAVIKAIHSEGVRLARMDGSSSPNSTQRLFGNSADITFRLLKFIRNFVSDLEVQKNRYWEWEAAIFEGYAIFDQLRREGQGTVTINLDNRSIEFKPVVCIDIDGKIAGLGSAACNENTSFELESNDPSVAPGSIAEHRSSNFIRDYTEKMAVLSSLGIQAPTMQDFANLQISAIEGEGISVKANGLVQAAMWARNVIAVKTTTTVLGPNSFHSTAIAISDN